MNFERFNELARNEKLEVRLLIEVALGRTPAEDWVTRWHTVGRRLRVDCEQLVCVHGDKGIPDQVGLSGEGALGERELLDLTLYEA